MKIINFPRRDGKTTEIVMSVINKNGILLTANQQEKKKLLNRYPALKESQIKTLVD